MATRSHRQDFAIKPRLTGHVSDVASELRQCLVAVFVMILAGCSGGGARIRDDAAQPDAATDARPNEAADAPTDAAEPTDARPDATPDAAPDAALDARPDAPPDAPADARPDAPADAPADASYDATPDGPPPEFVTVTLKFPPRDRQRGVVLATATPFDIDPLSEYSCTETCQFQLRTGNTIALQVAHVLGLPVTVTPTQYWVDLWQDTTFEIGSSLDPTSIHQWSDTTACRRVAALNTGEMLCVNDTLTKRDVNGEILWSRNEPHIDEVVVANDGSFLTADGRKWSPEGVVEWSVPVTSSRLRQIAIGPQNDVAMIDNTVDTHLHLFNANGVEMADIAPFLGRTFLAVRAAPNGDWVALEQEYDGFSWQHSWTFPRYSPTGVRLADFMQAIHPYFEDFSSERYFAVVEDTVIWLVNDYNKYFAGQASTTQQLDLVSQQAGAPCRGYGVGHNPMMQPIVVAANCNHSTAGLFTTDGRINLFGYYDDNGPQVDRRGLFPADAVLSPNGQFIALSGEFVNEPPTNNPYLSFRNTPVTAVLKYPTQ